VNSQPLVPLRALENHVYCPRQCAIIHGDGVWVHNEHTRRGVRRHQRVDSGSQSAERGKQVLRSIPLWSETLGLTGRSDVIELSDGIPIPVEYKSGSRHGDAADVQLCGQVLCLEEMFNLRIDHGFVWYGGPRRRHKVPMDATLRDRTLDIIQKVRADIVANQLPLAPNDGRCNHCQLAQHCLPGVVGPASGAAREAFADSVAEELFLCDT